MIKKTAVAAALAALAVPAVVQADKPEKTGKENAAAKKAKTKSVGFTVGGLYVSGFDLTKSGEQDLTSFTLKVTSANKHARQYLGLATKETKPSEESPREETITVADKAIVTFVGFEQDDTLDATDLVKVIGKVTRSGKGKSKTAEGGALDIRKITITDVEPAPAPAPTE
jgi:hypothetical protein